MSNPASKRWTAFWYAHLWCTTSLLTANVTWLNIGVSAYRSIASKSSLSNTIFPLGNSPHEALVFASAIMMLVGPVLLIITGALTLRRHEDRESAALAAAGYLLIANVHWGAFVLYKAVPVKDGILFTWIVTNLGASAVMDFCLEQKWTPFALLTGLWCTHEIRPDTLETSQYPWALFARCYGKRTDAVVSTGVNSASEGDGMESHEMSHIA